MNNELLIKVTHFFERLKADTQVYIDRNNYDGFYQTVWNILTDHSSELARLFKLNSVVGFKDAENQAQLETFANIQKKMLDKLIKASFEAMRANTPISWELFTNVLPMILKVE